MSQFTVPAGHYLDEAIKDAGHDDLIELEDGEHFGPVGLGLDTFTATKHLTIRNRPGHRPIIRGVLTATDNIGLNLRGIEINPIPTSRLYSDFPIKIKYALAYNGPGLQVVNCRIFNGLLNLSYFGSGWGTVYGTLLAHAGSTTSFYNIYSHNHLGGLRTFLHNIWLYPIAHGGIYNCHFYSEAANNIRDILFKQNVLVGGPFVADAGKDLVNFVVDGNFSWEAYFRVGRNNPTIEKREIDFVYNYSAAGFPTFSTPYILYYPTVLKLKYNKMAVQKQPGYAGFENIYYKRDPLVADEINFNEYHHIGDFSGYEGFVLNDDYAIDHTQFTYWQSEHGFDLNSTFETTIPVHEAGIGEFYFLPNKFADRQDERLGILLVYNYIGADEVLINSYGWGAVVGEPLRLVNAFNTDESMLMLPGVKSIPMKIWSVQAPTGIVGSQYTMSNPNPYFQVFIVEKTLLDLNEPPRALYGRNNQPRPWRTLRPIHVKYHGRTLA